MRLSDLLGSPLPVRVTFFSENDMLVVLRAMRPKSDFNVIEMLLIYETKKQRTWIVATGSIVYCMFDIKSEFSPRIRWELEYSDPAKIPIVVTDLNGRDGQVEIGGKKPRKYSKLLFQFQPIEVALRRVFDRTKNEMELRGKRLKSEAPALSSHEEDSA